MALEMRQYMPVSYATQFYQEKHGKEEGYMEDL
jgi:hypothetical protein